MKRETIQKKIVFETVRELANHPTADEVYTLIHESYPNISRATVYRNLNSLAIDGLLYKILGNGVDRYDHHLDDHAHVECTSCGKFEDIEVDGVLQLNERVEAKSGYKLIKHDIVFVGICSDCLKKA